MPHPALPAPFNVDEPKGGKSSMRNPAVWLPWGISLLVQLVVMAVWSTTQLNGMRNDINGFGRRVEKIEMADPERTRWVTDAAAADIRDLKAQMQAFAKVTSRLDVMDAKLDNLTELVKQRKPTP